jgi:hypothetical protein
MASSLLERPFHCNAGALHTLAIPSPTFRIFGSVKEVSSRTEGCETWSGSAEKAGIKGLLPTPAKASARASLAIGGRNRGRLDEDRGWRSRQMLQRYAASAADELAREAHKGLSPRDRL